MRLLAYALMPNHFHLVLWPESTEAVSAYMRWLMNAHIRCYQHHYGTCTRHIYRGRFKSFPIQRDGHLLPVLRYVEANPLRAGLVKRAEEWAWSSVSSEDGNRPALTPWPVARPVDRPAYVNRGDHGRAHVGVPEQFLHRPNIGPMFQQMGREAMPQCVTRSALGDAGVPHGAGDASLAGRFVQMEPARGHQLRIPADARGRKHELPLPVPGGIRVLPLERLWQRRLAVAASEVLFVNPANAGQMLDEAWPNRFRNHSESIFLACPAAQNNLPALEIEVFHAQFQTLEESQAGAVEDRGHQPCSAVQFFEHRPHLLAREHDRQVNRSLGVDDAVQIAERLVGQTAGTMTGRWC